MKKQKLVQLFLASLLVLLLASGCILKKETASEEDQEEISKEDTTKDEVEDIDEEKAADEEMNEEDAMEEESEDTITEDEEEITEAEWELVSGDPSDTCSSPTYKGEAKLRGWYVYDYSYVEKTWLFQVLEEDADKIPVAEVYGEKSYEEWIKKPQFLLGGVTPELETQLKNASSEDPVEVTVKGFRAYCEGAPQLSISGNF